MGEHTTGWAPRFGWPSESAKTADSLLDHATWLEGQIPDKFYGGKLRGPAHTQPTIEVLLLMIRISE